MSDQDSPDEQVRRLLADARHTEPVPADVAERLDAVLADLRADRPLRPVTDLAAAGRRRHARTMLIAAAAVVVIGVGIGQLGGGSGDEMDSATSDAGGTAAVEREQDGPAESQENGVAGGDTDDLAQAPQATSQRSARVTSEDFGDKALRLRPQPTPAELDSGAMLFEAKEQCIGRDPGAGTAVRIRYDGNPAVLVYRPPRGDTQVVDLYLCGRDRVVRSITLPAR